MNNILFLAYLKKHEHIIDTVHKELIISSEGHNDMFLVSPEKSPGIKRLNFIFYY